MTKYSTDNVGIKQFRPHGRVEFSVSESNLVLYRCTGPFNKALFDSLAEIEVKVLKQLQDDVGHWFEVVVFEHSCLAAEEFFDEFANYLSTMGAQGLVPTASAYVIAEDIEGRSIMQSKYEKCYGDTGLAFAIFTTQEEAIAWVKTFSD